MGANIATQITIGEELTQLAEVRKLSNGITVGRKKLRTDDLVLSLLSMMEPSDVMAHISTDKELSEEFFGPTIMHGSDAEINSLFQMMVARIEDNPDTSVVSLLLMVLAEKFDLAALDQESFNDVLRTFLRKVEDIEDKNVCQQLFKTMLHKVGVADTEDHQFLNETLNLVTQRIKTEEQKETIHQLFINLAQKAERSWVREVLTPYLEKQKVVRSPVLPKNCVGYFEELDGTKIVLLEIDKAKYDVTLDSVVYKKVGHPKLLFAFNVLNRRITRIEVMAVKDKTIKPTTKMFYYPFSNVHSNFNPCWNDRPSEVKYMSQLGSLPYLFLNSPTNDHLFRGLKGFTGIEDAFEKLQNKDFDNNLLEPAGHTVGGYFEIE